MSSPFIVQTRRRQGVLSRLQDYLELTKPRIATLELLTVAVGACVAGAAWTSQPWVLLHALFGTALLAASASALNQWLERNTDRHMERTRNRPLPAGRLLPSEVLVFGVVAAVAGVAYLVATANWITAALGFLSWFLYVCVYTPLKFRSTANTVVGAVAGALPILMGYAAVEGPLGGPSVLVAATLFLIVFLWQFPHFMAIAWLYRDEYTAAGIRILSVVDPSGRRAAAQSMMAALALVPVSALPAVLCWTLYWSLPYFAAVLVLSSLQLALSVRFFWQPDTDSARRLFRYTLFYLPAVLGLLLIVPLAFPRLG